MMTNINSANVMATRGGHFHKPDHPNAVMYKHTRRLHMHDTNTVWHNDVAPEFLFHYHSIQVQNSKAGWFYLLCWGTFIAAPMFIIGMKISKDSGANLFPTVRNCQDHKDMTPRLLGWMKTHDYDNATDFLGRKNNKFYGSTIFQDN